VDGTGIPYAGHSAAIDFKGLALSACDPEVAQVRTATLDKAKLEHFREHWPFYLDFD
jgi:predicted amidohydrolase